MNHPLHIEKAGSHRETGSGFSTGEQGQGIAEYAVMCGVVLTLLAVIMRMFSSNLNNLFAQAAAKLQ